MSTSRFARRLRTQTDEPGLRASIVADVDVVVSTSGRASSRSTVRVRQGRSAGSPAASTNEPEETQ